VTTEALNAAFLTAMDANRKNVVIYFLNLPIERGLNRAQDRNRPIRWAAFNGYVDIVRILLKDPTVDPTDCDNYAFKYAAENGHIDVVQTLMELNGHHKIETKVMKEAFFAASHNQQETTAQLLWKELRARNAFKINH
jgi:ankyrin repeat protein